MSSLRSLTLAVTATVAAVSCTPASDADVGTSDTISLRRLPLTQLEANGPELRQSGFAVSEKGNVAFTGGYSENDDVVTVIDTTGRVISRFGKPGEGPGEFRQAMLVFFRDSLVSVFDARLFRIGRFTVSGEHVDEISLPSFQMPLGFVGDSVDLFDGRHASVTRRMFDGSGEPRTLVPAGDTLIRTLAGRGFGALNREFVGSSPAGSILGDGITYTLWEYNGDTVREFGRNVVPRDTSVRNEDGGFNRGHFGFRSTAFDSAGRLWIAGREDDVGFFDVFSDYQFVQRIPADCPTNDASGISISGRWVAQLCLIDDPEADVEVALRLYEISGTIDDRR